MVTKSMNSNDYKVLYQKAEKEKIKNAVQKVKETYEQYEQGKIDFKDLKEIIVNDLQLSTTDNFDKLSNSAGRDNKTFAGLVKSLGILKDEKVKAPSFTPKQIQSATFKKFHRYVKNKTYNVPEPKEDRIQSSVNAFLKRNITSQELQNVLRENNINPGVEEINKYVRAHELGMDVKFNDILFAIKKINNNGVDPNKLQFEFKPPKYYTTHTQDDVPKAKKGKDNPNYLSKKDFFDWEANEQQQILNKLDAQPVNMTTKTKFIFDSNVFQKDQINKTDEKKSALKKVEPPKAENGNILTWKGNKQDANSAKEIKRRDPNVLSGTDCSTKSPKRKVLKMHEVSDDNAFLRKK